MPYDYFLGKKEGKAVIGVQRNNKHSIYCWRDEHGQETYGKNQMLYKNNLDIHKIDNITCRI